MDLAQVQTYVQTLLDDDQAVYWSPAQLVTFIQRSFLTVYTQMTQMQRGYFEIMSNAIGYVAGQELYSLAPLSVNGFVRLSLVERVDVPPNMTLLPIDISE